jgi:hypothetical protein
MPILPTDLLEPGGPITPKLFPGEQSNVLSVRLQGYIDRALSDSRVAVAAGSTQDQMARALALHFAFTDVYIRMSAEPMTLNVAEKGGHGYTAEQIRNMRGLADKYLDDLLGFLPGTTAVRPGTMAVPNVFGW